MWLTILIIMSTLSAQEKSISLDDINGGTFRPEYLSALRSMNNGKEYSIYNMIEKVRLLQSMSMTIKLEKKLKLY